MKTSAAANWPHPTEGAPRRGRKFLVCAGLIAGGVLAGCHGPTDASRAHTAALADVPPGIVHVRAYVVPGAGARFALPDTEVWVEELGSGVVRGTGATDVSGFAEIAALPPADYRLCWRAAGFGNDCPATVTVADGIVYAPDLVVGSKPTRVYGRVTLADGTAPFFASDLFATRSKVDVIVKDAGGYPVAGPVRANSSGEYAIAGVFSGNFIVEAHNETTSAAASILVTNGAVRQDLGLPNHAPRIASLLALDGGGRRVRRAAPASTVELHAEAVDADGDALHYRWATDHGAAACDPVDAPVAHCRLADGGGVQAVYVIVSDGRGQFASARVTLVTDAAGDLFSGTVSSSAGPLLAGVTVAVNGTTAGGAASVPAATTTDSAGHFAIVVPPADRYVLTLRKVGYQTLSRVYSGEAIDEPYRLTPVKRQTVDPNRPIHVVEILGSGTNRKPATLDIPAKGLVDEATGKPSSTPVDIYYSGIDLHDPDPRMPGDYTGIDRAGRVAFLTSYGAAEVNIFDRAGRRQNLAPGVLASLGYPVYSEQGAHPGGVPGTNPVWFYDEKAGVWREDGVATDVGGLYSLQVPHFSIINVDAGVTNVDCIRLDVDSTLPLPFRIKVTLPDSSGIPPGHPDVVADNPSVIARIPAGQCVTVVVVDRLDHPIPGTAVRACSRGVGSNALEPNIAECTGRVTLTRAGAPTPPAERLLQHNRVSTEAEANTYYESIDPTRSRDTFQRWKDENQFDHDDASAVYFNAGDLGFGRSMHMRRRDERHIAYYVTNYDTVDRAVDGSRPIATVAMEYSPPAQDPGGTPFTKFFVFDGGGQRVTGAALDRTAPNPDVQFVPKLCNVCHGGGASMDEYGDTRAKFIGFDLESFQYSRSDAPAFPFERGPQEDEAHFKGLNRRILETGPTSGWQALIEQWYGGPGLPAATQSSGVIPAAWVGHETLYTEVVKTSCRSCHLSQGLDWTSYSQFHALRPSIQTDVCATRVMPNAPLTWVNFWGSGPPLGVYRPGVLEAELGAACPP